MSSAIKTKRCLVSAGPTREYFDPVRYVSNPSSGKMGYAIAESAQKQGWEVELVSGPTALTCPHGVSVTHTVTANEMLSALQERFAACDILIMTAAVCDFKPKAYSQHKVKKSDISWAVEFEPVPDILKTLAFSKDRKGQILVGFAAESHDIITYAKAKLGEKALDYIIANDISRNDSGFESDHNSVSILSKQGAHIELPIQKKSTLADAIISYLSSETINHAT